MNRVIAIPAGNLRRGMITMLPDQHNIYKPDCYITDFLGYHMSCRGYHYRVKGGRTICYTHSARPWVKVDE